MIKLKDILTEIDYGNKLWADPDSSTGRDYGGDRYRDFIKKIYNNDTEYNTPEEEAVLKAVARYVEFSDKKTLNPYVGELLKLKKKFPNILEPKSSDQTGNKLYRGMTAAIDVVVKYIESAKAVNEVSIEGRKYFLLKGVNAKVTSRTDDNFVSLSTSLNSARRFGTQSIDRWPVITETVYSGLESAVIWNPEYLATLSNFVDELEVWFLNKSFPVNSIYIYSPDYEKNFSSLAEIVSKALNDRLQTDKDKAEISR